MPELLLSEVVNNTQNVRIHAIVTEATVNSGQPLLPVQNVVCRIFCRCRRQREVLDVSFALQLLFGPPEQEASYWIALKDALQQREDSRPSPNESSLKLRNLDLTAVDSVNKTA